MLMNLPEKRRGFTLIELMIVVAVIAILSMIAYPAYQSQVIKGNRAEGKSAVLKTAQALERYFTVNNTYVAGATANCVNPAFTTLGMPAYSGDDCAGSKYDMTIVAGAAGITTSFTVKATPRSPDPECGNLTYTQAGQKGMELNTESTVSKCW